MCATLARALGVAAVSPKGKEYRHVYCALTTRQTYPARSHRDYVSSLVMEARTSALKAAAAAASEGDDASTEEGEDQ